MASWIQDRLGPVACDIFTPSVRPRLGLLFLLDFDGVSLQSSAEFTRLLQEHNLATVALPVCPSWWSDKPCPAFHPQLSAEQFVLQEVLPLFHQRWNLAPRAIGIAGIGMGGQGALRLAFRHAHLFPVVAAISPAIDYHELYGQGTVLDDLYDSKEQCRQDTALLHINPHQYPPHIFLCLDPEDHFWYRGNDRLHEKLSALGIAHEADPTTRGGGHSWKYFEHMAERALSFVAGGLQKESLRLL